jgi:UDP-N-acetylglucosamine 1-carboxyvinyltransferase
MYESRMFFADKLITMGANITICDPHRLIITGPTPLRGKQLASPDVRAGMALVIAALIAKGQSHIHQAEIIGRGYQNLAKRLTALGADIREIED